MNKLHTPSNESMDASSGKATDAKQKALEILERLSVSGLRDHLPYRRHQAVPPLRSRRPHSAVVDLPFPVCSHSDPRLAGLCHEERRWNKVFCWNLQGCGFGRFAARLPPEPTRVGAWKGVVVERPQIASQTLQSPQSKAEDERLAFRELNEIKPAPVIDTTPPSFMECAMNGKKHYSNLPFDLVEKDVKKRCLKSVFAYGSHKQ